MASYELAQVYSFILLTVCVMSCGLKDGEMKFAKVTGLGQSYSGTQCYQSAASRTTKIYCATICQSLPYCSLFNYEKATESCVICGQQSQIQLQDLQNVAGSRLWSLYNGALAVAYTKQNICDTYGLQGEICFYKQMIIISQNIIMVKMTFVHTHQDFKYLCAQ